MKYISALTDKIADEINGAKEYAESYLYEKAAGSNRANTYKNMAQDELNHANNLHGIAVEEIEKLQAKYTPPVEMQEQWQKSHREYVEAAAWVKQMIAM